MDKNDLVNKIKKDIQDIYSISDRLNGNSQIYQIDIDLALSKVRNLYDLLLKLNPQEDKVQVREEKELPEPKKQVTEKPINEPIKKQVTTQIDEIDSDDEVEIKEPEFIIETPKKEVIKELPEEKSETNSNVSPEIIAEKFQAKKFIHDDISTKNSKKDVSTKLQSKPIKDINAGIGLNDKFIFIRELFEGDKEHYYETIQVLNNFDTYENAVEFLNKNFDWDSEDTNYERLKELVRRKYS